MAAFKPNPINYILGLDIGIASVGWAMVEIDEEENPIRLIDFGVRIFERAEVPKTGDSLAMARRLARSVRRLTRRRAHRLLRARRLLKREGVLQAADFDENGLIKSLPNTPWQLRAAALDRKLMPLEWSAVLLHLIKHRGYLSQRKNEGETADKELGALLKGVADNAHALQTGDFRTPAELALNKFEKESGHIRNQRGDYSHTFSRKDLQAELNLLFEKQKEFGNPHVSDGLKEGIETLLMTQRDSIPDESAILRMQGKCTFEKNKSRAAKHSWSAERFIWLSKLANLRITDEFGTRKLTEIERQLLIDLPYKLKTVSYQQVRNALTSLSPNALFNIGYHKKDKKGEIKSSDKIEKDTKFMEMKFWHKIKETLEGNGRKTEWQSLSSNHNLLDEIGTVFTICKNDERRKALLSGKIKEDQDILDILCDHVDFTCTVNLSLEALNNILPFMEQGDDYDTAWRKVYPPQSTKKESVLPPIPADEIRNPVVLRALSQARKVINGVVRRYGSPARIHIETAREVGKSFKDRKEIEKRQEENRKDREKSATEFREYFPNFVGEPKSKDILKLRLYKQQHGKCLYSGKEINLGRLNEIGYVEIDHALPFSRTWDDSFNNKVLVLGSENQNKGNQTPYEYFNGKGNSQEWQEFKARVETSCFPRSKKQRILLQKFDEDGFKERNLNDTRYVNRFLCQFVADHMLLTGKGKRRVFASNGQITNLLRGFWGLRKVRAENDRHHALDAVVVACSTVAMQQKITRFVRYKEMNAFDGKTIDKETGEVLHQKTHFPQPWEFFAQEIMIRVFGKPDGKPEFEEADTPEKLRTLLAEKLSSRPEAVHEYVTPLFVSRAPNRKMSGTHKDTLRSAKRFVKHNEKISVKRVWLTEIKLADLENMVNYKNGREIELYETLKARLKAYGGNAKQAFDPKDNPFYKKGGQLVKAVRVEKTQESGVLLNKKNAYTIADNGDMVRADVFCKTDKKGKNQYFIVPIYAWQVAENILPDIDCKGYQIDDSYTFCFSLHKYDLIAFQKDEKSKVEFAYYINCDSSDGRFYLAWHDKGAKEQQFRISTQNLVLMEKYQIDELGKEIRPCRLKKRPPVR
ncbi:TPA: type II CRISPR RNA-guided endonuclease Cas9 [Neisseria cinerea]